MLRPKKQPKDKMVTKSKVPSDAELDHASKQAELAQEVRDYVIIGDNRKLSPEAIQWLHSKTYAEVKNYAGLLAMKEFQEMNPNVKLTTKSCSRPHLDLLEEFDGMSRQ